MKTKIKKNCLCKQFFHTFNKENGKIQWQGYVLANPEPSWYLVQLFNWTTGDANIRKLVRIEKMEDWQFYANADEMKNFYENNAISDSTPN